jgi:hypothetical protein
MSNDLVAAKPKGLTDDEAEIGRLVTFGLPTDETIDGKPIKANWPLTLEQAARFVGYRCKKARNYLDNLPEFSNVSARSPRRPAQVRGSAQPRHAH